MGVKRLFPISLIYMLESVIARKNAWFLDGAGDRLFLLGCQSDNANQIMQT